MKHKTYAIVLISCFFAFFLANAFLWNLEVKNEFSEHHGHGDLQRLGNLPYVASITEPISYEKTHTEFSDYLASGEQGTFDILTIGDSFSNGAGGNYYQDELESYYHASVLNVPHYDYQGLEILHMLDTFGYLDRIQPKVIIIESVERNVQSRYGVPQAKSPSQSKAGFRSTMLRKPSAEAESLKQGSFLPGIMVKANLQYLETKFRPQPSSYRLSKSTDFVRLTSSAFTAENREDMLIFFHDDMEYQRNPINTDAVNNHMNQAAKAMQQKGILLIFLVCPDKFDVYYPQLSAPDKARWPENPFFDEMNIKQKEYIFIDSRKLLREAVASGEKDVYWSDDMHWSWKASKIVCAEIMRQLETTK